jgi:polar amino acid transport system substrate-binding protein
MTRLMPFANSVVAALFACLSALGAATGVVAAETFRVTHNQPFPPFAELKNGKSEGLAIDILHAAAARVGIELEFVATPLEPMGQTLVEGRADALLVAATPERMATFDLSAPVLTTGGALFVRAPNPTPESLAALSGKVVVTPQTGPLAAIIQRTAPNVNLSVTTDYAQSLERVVEGKADAAALNYQAGAIIAARLYSDRITVPRKMFQETPLAIGAPKGKQFEILVRLSKGLEAIRADGTWQNINTRWIAH